MNDMETPRASRAGWAFAAIGACIVALAAVLPFVIPIGGAQPAGGPAVTAPAGAAAGPATALQQQAEKASASAPAGVVRAVGTHFVLDGQPWRFVGFDDYKLTSLDDPGAYTCGGGQSDETVETDFAEMQRRGATVLRTWFFQSYYVHGGWRPFDRVLADAARYGIKVIPVLANQWGTCESDGQHPDQYKTLDWYQYGYATQLDYGYAQTYRDWAVTMARHYAGNPTIAFWQLMNEAEASVRFQGTCDEHDAALALQRFGDDVAGAIKSVDPVHLVSLGTIGGSQCGTNGGDYRLIHIGRIDICEYHDYEAVLSSPLRNRCASLGKPMFAGERGFTADLGTGVVTETTLARRAADFRVDLQRAFAADGCQGYLIWSFSDSSSSSYDVGSDDPTNDVLLTAAQTVATPLAVYRAVERVGAPAR